MKAFLRKLIDGASWIVGVVIVLVTLVTSAYFIFNWHRRKKSETGTISNPDADADRLHVREISEAINTLWEFNRTGKN